MLFVTRVSLQKDSLHVLDGVDLYHEVVIFDLSHTSSRSPDKADGTILADNRMYVKINAIELSYGQGTRHRWL